MEQTTDARIHGEALKFTIAVFSPVRKNYTMLNSVRRIMEKGGPLLLEEPELSLHPEIVRVLPQMFARVQRRTRRQILLSTHSPELLRDDGIGLDEVLLLIPGEIGTKVSTIDSDREIRDLLDGGLSLADIVVPRTRPMNAEQSALFADD